MSNKRVCASCGTDCRKSAKYCPRCGVALSAKRSDVTSPEQSTLSHVESGWSKDRGTHVSTHAAARKAAVAQVRRGKTSRTWLVWIIIALALVTIRGYIKGKKEHDALELKRALMPTADDIVLEKKLHYYEQQNRVRLSDGNPELYRQLREDDEQADRRIFGRD